MPVSKQAIDVTTELKLSVFKENLSSERCECNKEQIHLSKLNRLPKILQINIRKVNKNLFPRTDVKTIIRNKFVLIGGAYWYEVKAIINYLPGVQVEPPKENIQETTEVKFQSNGWNLPKDSNNPEGVMSGKEGHYTVYVNKRESGWYYIDDENVTQVNNVFTKFTVIILLERV